MDELQKKPSTEIASKPKLKPNWKTARLNPGQIALSNELTLKKLTQAYGEIKVVSALVDLVFKLSQCFNITQNLTEEQIINVSRELLLDYPNYRLEDFEKCFSMASKGEFGKLDFNRIDPQIIYLWLKEYDLIRNDEIIKERARQASERKKEGLPDYLADIKLKYVNKENKPVEDNPKIQDWMREFDKLYYEQGGTGNTRFVKIEGNTYSISDYLVYRLNKDNNGI